MHKHFALQVLFLWLITNNAIANLDEADDRFSFWQSIEHYEFDDTDTNMFKTEGRLI